MGLFDRFKHGDPNAELEALHRELRIWMRENPHKPVEHMPHKLQAKLKRVGRRYAAYLEGKEE